MQEEQSRIIRALMHIKAMASSLALAGDAGMATQALSKDIDTIGPAGQVRCMNDHAEPSQKLKTTSRSSVMSRIA